MQSRNEFQRHFEFFHFLFEPSSIQGFLQNIYNPKFSHDLNLMQLAQSALDNGIYVEFSPFDNQSLRYGVKKAWPLVELVQLNHNHQNEKSPSFVFSANHLAFINRKRQLAGPKNILIQAAIHIFEQPKIYFPNGSASYINTFRNVIDFVITQNSRMADLLFSTMSLVCGYQDPQRILISKLSPSIEAYEDLQKTDRASIRKNLGIEENAIVIVNAGGAWKWTQFNDFLKAFIEVIRSPQGDRFFLIQPALAQKDNSEHIAYNKETYRLLEQLSPQEKSRILIGTDWANSGQNLKTYLRAADYGLNINLDTLEQWQSYRVRVLEYISARLPIIMSRGSFWDDHEAKDAFIFTGHNRIDFENTLFQILQEHDLRGDLERRRTLAFSNLLTELSLLNQSNRVIDELLSHPDRFKEVNFNNAVIWDYRMNGPQRQLTVKRIFARIYYSIVNNSLAHSFLVTVGVRKVVRLIRKVQG